MGHAIGKGNYDDELFPVSPGDSGYGLPYAPVDCPKPGDIWRWAATGKALKQNGLFKDRVLYVPERLQKRPSRKLGFMSKKSVENFLRSELPQVDINAFFQSFTWDIPAKTNPKRKENMMVTHTQSAPSRGMNKKGLKRTRQCSHNQEERQKKTTSDVMEIVDKEGEDGTDSAVADADGNICESSVPDCKLMTKKNLSMEEFDNYINSLDEMVTVGVNNDYMLKKENGGRVIFDARQKLSSLLAMGFPTLVTSNKLNELLCLASELKNDDSTTLTQQEHSILKLIQEIPSVIPHYLQVKQSSLEADKFFVELESKIMNVNCLKNEYTNAKEEKEVFQTEESSLLLSVMETNDEIEKLKLKRMELTETIKKTNKKIVQCNWIQQKVMNCLPQLVQEVQIANSKKTEWQIKKKEFSQQEDEILAKFAPFLGFSFHKTTTVKTRN